MTEAPRASDTVSLVDLTKRYGATRALDGVSLSVAPGEFFTLLGPSGCGKTTTLRSVAGFVTPDAGEVAINGRTVTGSEDIARIVTSLSPGQVARFTVERGDSQLVLPLRLGERPETQ